MNIVEIKVTEIGNQLDPNKKDFIIDVNGRTPALKVEYGDGEYDLYICYQNNFHRSRFTYESNVLKYFKSNKLNKLVYIETINMKATDTSYIEIQTGAMVDSSVALDVNGQIKSGYLTEAMFYEQTVGPIITDAEFTAIKRKNNLPPFDVVPQPNIESPSSPL